MMKPDISFEEGTTQAADIRRQRGMLALNTVVLAAYLLAYGTYYLAAGQRLDGSVEVFFGVLLVVNWFLFLWHRRIVFAKPAFSIACGAVLLILLVDGGVNGTAAGWSLIFPPVNFLFQGVLLGAVYNVIFLAAQVLFALGVKVGVVHSYYTFEQLQQTWSALLLMNLLGYVAESGWEKARRAVVEQGERLRSLLNALPIGVIMVEADGKPSAANQALRKIVGQQVTGEFALDDLPARLHLNRESGMLYPENELPLWRALHAGESITQSDVFLSRPDGERAVLRVSAAPVRDADGRVTAAVAAYEDVTREYAVDRMKSEFISLASHQLKMPLTGVKWSAESLLSGDTGGLNDGQRAALQEMIFMTDRVLRLVSDLLDVSHIETGTKFTVMKTSTDVMPIVMGVVRDIAPLAAKHRVTVSTSRLPGKLVLDIDGDKVREALANIVGNAVKYSKVGGTVEIGVVPSEKDDRVTLSVKDHGIGIPQSQQSKVFEKFFRAENVPEDSEGTGLGLYIVRTIVDRHGGRIWFESQEGKGTTFFMELPAAKQA